MLAEWRRSLAHLGRLLQASRTASGLVSMVWMRRPFALEYCGSLPAISIFNCCSEYATQYGAEGHGQAKRLDHVQVA
eukprot:501791-Amphidinium_carterae.2